MFASAQPTSTPTAVPTAAPSGMKLRPYDNEAIYVFYALMISFACIFTTVLLMKLCAELQNSEFVSDCCARINARCCACVEATKEQPLELPEVCDVEIVPEHELWINLSNDFEVQEPQPAEVCAV